MNKEYRLNILMGSLCQSVEKMGIVSQFKFYQDNDPNIQWPLLRNGCCNLARKLCTHLPSPSTSI